MWGKHCTIPFFFFFLEKEHRTGYYHLRLHPRSPDSVYSHWKMYTLIDKSDMTNLYRTVRQNKVYW